MKKAMAGTFSRDSKEERVSPSERRHALLFESRLNALGFAIRFCRST